VFRTNPETWKAGAFWDHTYAKIEENRRNRLVQSLRLPEQVGSVPGSDHYSKSALVCPVPFPSPVPLPPICNLDHTPFSRMAFLTCSSVRNMTTFQLPSRPKLGRKP
jgi:hypothetical protein